MRFALLLFVTVFASACSVLNGDDVGDDIDLDIVDFEQLSEDCYAACNRYHELMCECSLEERDTYSSYDECIDVLLVVSDPCDRCAEDEIERKYDDHLDESVECATNWAKGETEQWGCALDLAEADDCAEVVVGYYDYLMPCSVADDDVPGCE